MSKTPAWPGRSNGTGVPYGEGLCVTTLLWYSVVNQYRNVLYAQPADNDTHRRVASDVLSAHHHALLIEEDFM
jgi:hypothetical protein